jgi:hypothetical protein
MVSGIKAKSYEKRCKELGLDTLEKRRNIQDMVETFRILCSNNDGYASGILEAVRTTGARTRQAAEPLNLVHKYARTEVRRNSFSVRVAEPWNKLSRETREAKNVQQFKRLLKNEWKYSDAKEKKSDEKQPMKIQSTALKTRKTVEMDHVRRRLSSSSNNVSNMRLDGAMGIPLQVQVSI